MARMLSLSARTWVGCCNACARGKPSRHKPGAMLRHAGRAAEKQSVKREIRDTEREAA